MIDADVYLSRCMAQDCQQSLAGSSQSYSNYCRFLDSNGFCYSYREAQVTSEIYLLISASNVNVE
jgi:hypothetical protein